MTREENNVFAKDPTNKQPDIVKQKIEEAKRSGNQYRTQGEVLKVQDVGHDPLGLDIPTELVPLPSEGKVYPPGHPLHNVKGVEIHPMTAREEDILTTRAYLKKGTVMTELLKSCLVDKRIDPNDMIMGDKSAIMVAIRITGYTHEYFAEITCSECQEKYKNTFDLSLLEVKGLGESPRVEFTNEFEFALPRSKKRVIFRLMNGHDENEVSAHEERRKKLKITLGENTVTRNLFQCIISIDGVTDRAQISRFVNSMSAVDSRALRNYMNDIAPNVDMTQETKCPYCDYEDTTSMPMNASFFWPDVGK